MDTIRLDKAKYHAAMEELWKGNRTRCFEMLASAVVPEPTELTVGDPEPPVGTKVVDRDGDVWERREDGWDCRAAATFSMRWDYVVNEYGPVEIR